MANPFRYLARRLGIKRTPAVGLRVGSVDRQPQLADERKVVADHAAGVAVSLGVAIARTCRVRHCLA